MSSKGLKSQLIARLTKALKSEQEKEKSDDADKKENQVSPSLLFSSINFNRGSYMSAHVLLNLLNELGKSDKMRGLPSILSLFRKEFKKFNNTKAQMLDSIYHYDIKITLKSYFCRKNIIFLFLHMQRCYGRQNVSRKSISH